MLRTNLTDRDPKKLWRQYIQLTEIEAVFRTLKTELNLRPIFHRIQRRVEAHILIAFLGYCLWVCLKQKLRAAAGSLTPAQVVHSLKQLILVEVWFDLRKGAEFVCRASPIPKPTNSLSCTIWAGHCRSNRHPKSTETKTNLVGRPEAPKSRCLKINKLHHLIDRNCETQVGAQRGDRGWSFPQVHACSVGDGYAATFRQYQGNQQTEDEFRRSRSSQACGRIRSQKQQNNRAITA